MTETILTLNKFYKRDLQKIPKTETLKNDPKKETYDRDETYSK